MATVVLLLPVPKPARGAPMNPPVANTMSAGDVASFAPPNVALDASIAGAWGAPIAWPSVAMHMILLNTGKVLTFRNGTTPNLWDPATGLFKPVPTGGSNVFCSGTSQLADGRVITLGGDYIRDVNVFDPQTETWARMADMFYARFYPTSTTLPDGRVLATAGASASQDPEVYDPVANTWTDLSAAAAPLPYYPHVFVLPDGSVLDAGASEVAQATTKLDLSTQTWTTVDPRILDGGSSVMYAPGKIMKAGSATDVGGVGPSAATAYIIDASQPNATWQQTGSMAYARSFLNLTLLPDGDVLASGGDTTRRGSDESTAVLAAEKWSPVTNTWTTMASEQIARLYHSSAVLLPDGRVLVGGGGADGGVPDESNAEVYSPPYLFKGARPSVTSSPSASIPYGGGFFVGTPDAASIASVSLIRAGAVTHSFDENTRRQSLSFQAVAGGLTVQAPANANDAPPGDYMLFIVNGNGVPSVAPFVRFGGGGALPTPTATNPPGGPTSTPTVTSTPGAPTSTPTATSTPGAATSTATSTPPAGNSQNFGRTSSIGLDDTSDAGYINGTTATLSTAGRLASLSVYVGATSGTGRIRLALYSSNGSGDPGALIAETGEALATTGWQSLPAPAVDLAPGTYWIAAQADSPGTLLRYQSGLPGSDYWGWTPQAYGAFPASVVGWFKASTTAFAMYGTITTASGPTPTASPIATCSRYDVNGDKVVNSIDLGYVARNYGTRVAPYDVNGDGIVNSIDLGLVALNFGRRCA